MPQRTAEATWRKGLKDGNGNMRLGSGAYDGAFSFASRFEEGTGSNPEELLGAALAGCFSMALSADLEGAGFTPESVSSEATVTLDMSGDEPTVTEIHLETEANVPGIDDDTFQEHVTGAKENCPVSRALAVPSITVDARLV